MREGDLVRLVRLPEELPEGPPLNTRNLFENALGQCFRVAGIENGLVELLVGEVLGEPDYMHSIYVEPEYLELVEAV